MCTALEFRVSFARLALQFSIFTERVAIKDGSNSFGVLLVGFIFVVSSLPPLLGQ